jgi:hypothetical protein
MDMPELSSEDRNLLERAVDKHAPSLLPLLSALGDRQLTSEEREGLRGALADELVSVGLEKDDEPTEYGLRIDSLIGRLMNF